MVEASSTQPDSKESSEMVETASTQSPGSEEISGMVEGSSTQPDSQKSSEMVEGFSTQLNGQEVSDEMVGAASTQTDGKESSDMDEDASTQPDGKESTEMVEATSTESDIQTEKLASKEISEMVEAASTQPDYEEISEMVKASSTQPDSKESNEMVKGGSTQLDSQGVSETVEAGSTQSDDKKIGEIVQAASTQPDNKESNDMVAATSTQSDNQGVSEMFEATSTQSDDTKRGEIVEAASTQPDGKEMSEIVEAASTQSDGKESTETEQSASTQSDGKESTKMVKAASTQSDIQNKIQEKRKELAESLGELKEKLRQLVSEEEVDLARYRLLVRAIYDKDVKFIEHFINEKLNELLDARIDELGSTIFHLIVQVPGTDALIKKLVSEANRESLERKDIDGYTALHSAAMIGNTKAVELFVRKNRKLLSLKDNYDFLPVDCAIYTGRKETAEYLHLWLDLEKGFDEEFLEDRAYVLYGLIQANYIDLAFEFLYRYPMLADRCQNGYWKRTIRELAGKDMGLPRGTWQRFIYHYIPVKTEKHNSTFERKDIENQSQTSQKRNFFAKFQYKLWNALLSLVPGLKCINDQKLLHEQTIEMVRLMIAKVTWSFEEALESLKEPMLTAAMLGNHRFVEEILKAYNYSFLFYDEHGHTIFHLAVLHRQENVFNLIHNQVPFIKDRTWMTTDDTDGNILHLAGRLVPSNEVPGAALQMQRELQWFKTVENIFHPKLKVQLNLYEKTPKEVFTEEHEMLVKKGEKWMTETATACSVVAALIITVVFATAYTFPGGINGEGLPNFLPKTSFKVFLVSIALALFSSTASVQMFLGILTSRYAENDFLESLPKKLSTGLITLFFSIASMMVAFASTFHIFLQPWKWVTFVIMAVLVFAPVTLFAFMQFPLLVDIIKSTYGSSILRPMRYEHMFWHFSINKVFMWVKHIYNFLK